MIQTTQASYADRLPRARTEFRFRPQQLLGFVIWTAFLLLLVASST